MAREGLGALDSQHRHFSVQDGKRGGVGAVRNAQAEALPIQPEGEGGDEAAHGHAAQLGEEHGAGGGERQPARLEILYPLHSNFILKPCEGHEALGYECQPACAKMLRTLHSKLTLKAVQTTWIGQRSL